MRGSRIYAIYCDSICIFSLLTALESTSSETSRTSPALYLYSCPGCRSACQSSSHTIAACGSWRLQCPPPVVPLESGSLWWSSCLLRGDIPTRIHRLDRSIFTRLTGKERTNAAQISNSVKYHARPRFHRRVPCCDREKY